MCGIVGVVGRVSRFETRFGMALDSIAHRGPDGEGVLAREDILFGHRRLAIIDLSPGGYQPMIDADTGTVMIFNGEIYNYREVRSELEALGVAFTSRSDGEVLLRAFIHWRHEMFSRLNGMWAFAIWEPSERLLTLSRDRFGVKPLYWRVDRGTLSFASEAKALIALEPSLAQPNERAVYDLVVHSRSHAGDASYYRDIKVLPPASVARFRIGDASPAIQNFWHYPDAEGREAGSDTDASFAALFEDAVKLRMRSDVPIGLTLSGGLDSSAVLAAAQKLAPAPVRCFTSVYDSTRRGEEKWARIAADAAGAALESVAAAADDWLSTLSQIVHHMDGPGFSPAVFPLWAIMKRAREAGVPVLLEGQGADELLAGYPQHGAAELAGLCGSALRGRTSASEVQRAYRGLTRTFRAKELSLWIARQQAPSLFNRLGPVSKRRRLFRTVEHALGETARVARRSGYNPLLTALHDDHANAVLPALLHYGDSISMAHGIEGRLPFMDYRLVEWVFRSRPRLIVDGRTKAPVREYLAANGMTSIATRADKQGYPTMVAEWLNTGAGRAYVDDLMGSPGAPIWSLLDRAGVQGMVTRARGGDSTPVYHLYKIVSTQIWLSQLADMATARPRAARNFSQMVA